MIFDTPDCHCLGCGTLLNCVGNTGGTNQTPDEKSTTVCMKCGAVMMLSADWKVRPMTEQEVGEFLADKVLMAHVYGLVGKVNFLRGLRG